MKLINTPIAVILIMIAAFNSTAQSIPTFRTRVSATDTINPETDTNFGVGDDGIYNVVQPTVIVSSEFKSYKGGNIHDFNLTTAWIEGNFDKYAGVFAEFTFDLSSSGPKDSALSINSVFFINGYRKSIKDWEQYSRVKKLKMYINNVPFAYIFLMDTYKFQSVKFQDYWIKYGERKIIRFEIVEIYPGTKYSNAALSELQFRGRYSENMH
jgi:hypothetical protein